MTDQPQFYTLRCPACAWQELCGPEGAARWLRKAGKVRLGREPELDILYEVFRASAPQWTCPQCAHAGLIAAPADDDEFGWPGDVRCATCGKPITPERLRAVPGATQCAACQRSEELGQGAGATEYCPRCGAPLALRLAKSAGLARYVNVCTGNPPCRL